MFSSTYTCETLFSETNHIKNKLMDDCSSASTALKVTQYQPDVKKDFS